MGRFIAKEEKRGDSVVVAPCPMAWIPRIREPLWTKLGQQEERPKGEEHNTIVIITINITRDRLQSAGIFAIEYNRSDSDSDYK